MVKHKYNVYKLNILGHNKLSTPEYKFLKVTNSFLIRR